MSRKAITLLAGCFMLFVCASLCRADDWGWERTPVGVYVHVDIETAIMGYKGPASPGDVKLHKYLRGLYGDLLADRAIAGITAGRRWDNIQKEDPVCIVDHTCTVGTDGIDWSYLDDVFEAAHAAHKPVQLILTPGVDSPPWLFAKIPPCDDLFTKGSAPADCGTMKFAGFPEAQRADGHIFPMPWNKVYQKAWADFLVRLNERYKDDPAFIAFAVAGPNGASDEIILPTSANDKKPQPSGELVDQTWGDLIHHAFPNVASYQNTDQAFIDAWKQAIDTSEGIFRGVTLVLSADSGDDLPEFSDSIPPHPDRLYDEDCGKVNHEVMSCEAKTEILWYFVNVPGPNGKATQVGGMAASTDPDPGDIGIAGVKLLTALWPPPWPRIQGGAEFDHSVSGTTKEREGCRTYPKPLCEPLTVVDAAYNVLTVFFDGTPAGPSFDGTWGPAPIEYLEVPLEDVQYAEANLCPVKVSTVHGSTSLQDLLNQASHDLFEMAGRFSPLPPHTCP